MKGKLLLTLPGLLLTGVLFYLSWIPDPHMGNLAYLPRGLSKWADEHSIARTGVGMFPLGVLIGVWLGIDRPGFHKSCFWAGGLVGLLLAMELGQVLIPGRVFDWADVQVGAGGGFLGMVSGFSMSRTWRELSSMRNRKKYRVNRMNRIQHMK